MRAVAADLAGHGAVSARPGEAAARLLPGVDDVLGGGEPWVNPAPPMDRGALDGFVESSRGRLAEALIVTSFHQSPLPLALLLRLAGVGGSRRIEDYPGTLLDSAAPGR